MIDEGLSLELVLNAFVNWNFKLMNDMIKSEDNEEKLETTEKRWATEIK